MIDAILLLIVLVGSCSVPFIILGTGGPDTDQLGRRYYVRNGTVTRMYPFPKRRK